MKQFDAWRLTKMLYLIECARRDGIKYEIEAGRRDEEVAEEFKAVWINDIIEDACELATKAELESTNGRVGDYGGFVLALKHGLSYQELDHELKVLRESVQTDLGGRFVYIVSKQKQPYVTQTDFLEIWGIPNFYFRAIRDDVVAAVRAYAFGLNTACVFHLMRVTEIGLRALARRMKVTLPKKKQVEWAQWQEIINAMNEKVDKLAQIKRPGKAKDDQLEFYRGAIGELQGFKDAYRNFVMHMREKNKYDEEEAHSLILRVAHFLNRLAAKIDEQGHALTEARKKRIFAKLNEEQKAAEKEKQLDKEARQQAIPTLQHGNGGVNKNFAEPDQTEVGCGEASVKEKAEC